MPLGSDTAPASVMVRHKPAVLPPSCNPLVVVRPHGSYVGFSALHTVRTEPV